MRAARVAQQHPHILQESTGGIGRLAEHLRERPDRDVLSQHVAKQLRHPVELQVLVHRQVRGEGPPARPVTRGGGDRRGEQRLGLTSTRAPTTLDDMLGDMQADLGKVEHLAALRADEFSVGEIRAA